MAHRLYPIGARWKATNRNGVFAKVWLEERDKYLEVWKWEVRYKDRSLVDYGIKNSYVSAARSCKTLIAIRGCPDPRFERVWNQDE